ncbi:MAG: PilZ domain-containing protein [Bacteriovoracaceae bacterium]|nr:PilZ domain-containing protein [Bacteriovoracaceae bacterium]
MDIQSLIKEAHTKKKPLIAWYFFVGKMLKAELDIVSVLSERKKIKLQAREKSFIYLKEMISGSGEINIYIPEYQFFFTTKICSLDDLGELTIEFPDESSVVDRRGGQRFSLSDDLLIELTYKNKKTKKKCFDISSGGFSIILSKSEKLLFKEDQLFDVVNVYFGSQQITLSAKIKNILKLKPFMVEDNPYGAFRISFQFVDVDDLGAQLKLLTDYIQVACARESHK